MMNLEQNNIHQILYIIISGYFGSKSCIVALMRMKILEMERKKLASNTVYSLNTLYTVHAPEPSYCISNFTSLAPVLVTLPPANSNIIRLPCRVCALSVEIMSIGCMLGI